MHSMPADPAATSLDVTLERNLDDVRARIGRAALRAGRDPAAVTLVAVTKSVGASIIARLARAGASDLGENRIADAEQKIRALPAGPTWHLIGHLQSNKARRGVTLFPWIHSVDSVELLERLDRIAAEERIRPPTVLLQVNVSGEAQKHGVAEAGLEELAARATRAAHLQVAGLMTMAPLSGDPEASRPVFRRLRELRDGLCASGAVGPAFRHLSMGMTDDFEVAVEEGATIVRVGRALFRGCEGA
jgi:pyridoxal phosphate enzyme (YggS family)